MPHSHVSQLMHCVFSTKERRPYINPELKPRLMGYIVGICDGNHMRSLAANAVEDHMHILLSLPGTISIAKAIQMIKGSSSKWLHETFPDLRHFAWQEGYGAFSIGISQMDDTIDYIRNQEEHHRKHSFQEEFLAILKKHGIQYDERYLWG